MTLLLDTCVVSEAAKPQANEHVREWLTNNDQRLFHISAVTVGEIRYGISRLRDGKRRRELEQWLQIVREDFSGRILPLDETVAIHWGQLRANHPNVPLVDCQLAATAMAHGFTFVTRNAKDFPFPGLAVFNPWSK